MNTHPLTILSSPIVEHIFSYLTPSDLCIAEQVCSDWKAFSSQDKFWKEILEKILKDFKEPLPLPSNQFKKFFKEHIAISNDDIAEKVQTFITKLLPEKKGCFQCIQKSNDDLKPFITIHFWKGLKPFNAHEKEVIHQTVLAIHSIGEGDLKNPLQKPKSSRVFNSSHIQFDLNLKTLFQRIPKPHDWQAIVHYSFFLSPNKPSQLEEKIKEIVGSTLEKLHNNKNKLKSPEKKSKHFHQFSSYAKL